jgi:hypothetical protein
MRAQLEQIGQTVKEILARASEDNLPTGEVADKIAEEKFKA